MSDKRIESTGYPEEGYALDVGAMWEIPEVLNSLRDLVVIANADGIRIRDMYCGEWEMAERAAVCLSLDEARMLSDSLLAAIRALELHGDDWRGSATRAHPHAALQEALEKSLRRMADEDPPSVTA